MTLPINGELTPQKSTSPEFEFTGERAILIVGGSGTVQIQRSLCQSEFYPLTDSVGNIAEYSVEGGVAFNAEIANSISGARYRIAATSVDTPITYIVCK